MIVSFPNDIYFSRVIYRIVVVKQFDVARIFQNIVKIAGNDNSVKATSQSPPSKAIGCSSLMMYCTAVFLGYKFIDAFDGKVR